MAYEELGELIEIDVRDVWKHEQYDFSKWLSQEKSIKKLGNLLNLSLTDVETEKFVGSYRCDIICKDELTGKTVLIENQLEQTNHDHLGKIITYASGLDAAVVVWIVSSVKEEHASAIEWLNKHTAEDLDFFLIEVHAVKIGDSLPAPMFKVIEQPNDFAKRTKKMAQSTEINSSQQHRLQFWTMFNEVLEDAGKPFNKRKATTDHWYSVAVGRSGVHISIELVNKMHKIRVGLWISDDKDLFDELFAKKEQIEKMAGTELTWDRIDDKKASVVYTYIPGLNFSNQDNYTELMHQSIEKVIALRKAFAPYL